MYKREKSRDYKGEREREILSNLSSSRRGLYCAVCCVLAG